MRLLLGGALSFGSLRYLEIIKYRIDMNISFSWLKRYIDFDLAPEETAKILTSIGLEVASVEKRETIKGGLEGLVIGKVLTCEAHQNSDHLHVTTVDIGGEEPLHIVCGAPNVASGQTVVVATIGTTLYDGDESFTIKKGKIRGEVSEGMICSAKEIGLSSDHSGIMVLEGEVKPGTLAKEYFEVTSDFVIEVDITPNRVDATSHYGVARDLYAYLKTHGYEVTLKSPCADEVASIDEEPISLTLEDAEGCPRYMGVVIKDMKVGESPKWLKDALEIIGQRSINSVVDIANYVLFELGQPLHTFDLAKIGGGEVRVRFAQVGEVMETLDGSNVTLMERDLVIADKDKPLCLAGVMGGIDSGVTGETTDMFLEVATFDPTCIRKSARRHGFSTDASFRYERGLDPNQLPMALRRAVSLIVAETGGRVASKVYDLYPIEQPSYNVTLSMDKLHALTGLDIPESKVLEILSALEMEVLSNRQGVLQLSVPRYRYDVTRDIDVIEDVLRIYGYNEYPEKSSLTSTISVKSATDMSVDLQKRISEQLTGAGFNEILNNSLSKAKYYVAEIEAGKAVQLLNPLSSDLSTMRMSLIHGGLEVIEFNLHRQARLLRLYEFGNCYRTALEGEESELSGFKEEYRLGIWMTGDKALSHWCRSDYQQSVFELKAVMLNVLRRLGLNESELLIKSITEEPNYAIGEEITLRGAGVIGKWGMVSQELLSLHDIDVPVYFAELQWNGILDRVLSREVKVRPIALHPVVRRDFALLLDKDVTFAEVQRVAKKAGGKLVKDIQLFDVYDDPKHMEAGKKSYAVTFGLQDSEQTLSDKVIEKTMDKIYQTLNKELGATLR